jgi:diphthamide biosynthesis methyltransferase
MDRRSNYSQEAFYGRSVVIADREMVESSSDEILANADKVDVAFLVVGDPFGYDRLEPYWNHCRD